RQLEISDIQVSGYSWMRLGADGREGFVFARQFGVDANDGVLRRKFLVRHFNCAIVLQDGLKAIDRLEPGEILDVPEWLCQIPGDDHAIRQFLYIVRPGCPRFEEHTD